MVEYCAYFASNGMVDACSKDCPSGGSRESRKRARYPEITSTASKRAVARESTGGAVTMPDIDGKKSPVKEDYSMKTEVQLFC